MKISIDKTLPVSLQAQIVGAIEYGIMAGTFHQDAALPSVRALSKTLGVAQLTVSHAYNALKTMGLIETIPGKGTYVVHERQVQILDNQVTELRQRFQQLLADGEGLGLSPSFFIGLLNQDPSATLTLPFKVAFVGNSNRINQCYLETIQQTLNLGLQADSFTFHEFDELQDTALESYALYITIPHCIPRLRQRLADKIPVFAPYLLPSENTRMQLAALPADSQVLLVSRFENFIPAMLEGVKSFAPHLGEISVITLDDDDLPQALKTRQIVIYSTGCHSYLQQFPAAEVMFEYRHTPEPRYLRESLLPALHQYAQKKG
ncbi:GntR family transcriptional regulator [Citrobacter rodentium]|jgi:Predicted transcriptional regulators|uniref:GntR-family transcriptional regulator n=2 Tax=Citrobacter rodentium TaxID=67825 RepID=D2TIG5_CITRI|nr:GntR family transcriptional regulator [Citrobacter rodentium]KIQ51312.1 GntR family transcriptional regulator [Citrobacter rodentium]QBY28121.1 GntR family transcriptional regulator [Citrobacter rodentium]UHO30001.1 GntR family transcriptional regulator [Citrobacter rodentium NBRC 105723 = DSM 16636]CBG88292.1 putative GntR-family transcriptional regulator [Citrobacter rodentium ICC168]HAT8011498.1 GntR family transcriptional regulator [Citrobacter rodentium NBRC 105723 = DSM 16636]